MTESETDKFSRFCHFPKKEATSKKYNGNSETEFVMGILNEVYITKNIYKIISEYHNTFVGYHGFHRTCTMIVYYILNDEVKAKNDQQLTQPWPAMRDHVCVFFRRCSGSQKIMSKLKMPIHTQSFTTASHFPVDKVAVDNVGQLPPDENGNKYLIVFRDCFSQYVCRYPVPDVTGLNFAEYFIEYCRQHPIPSK